MINKIRSFCVVAAADAAAAVGVVAKLCNYVIIDILHCTIFGWPNVAIKVSGAQAPYATFACRS